MLALCLLAVAPAAAAGALLRAQTAEVIRMQDLRPGTLLRGEVKEAVYAGTEQLIPAGSRMEMEVASVEKEPVPERHHMLRTLARLFLSAPGRKPPAYHVRLQSARCILPGGAVVPLEASLVDLGQTVRVQPKVRKKQETSTMVVRLERPHQFAGIASKNAAPFNNDSASRSPAKLMLLCSLSASGNREGESFRAYVVEPVRISDRVLIPAGSTFEGRIVHRMPPRWLHRAGRLRLSFQKLILPDGVEHELSASVTGASVERESGMRMDGEGTMTAGPATKRRLALDLGLSYVVGKVTDDLLEEGVKAGIGTAASGSAAVAARYVGLAAGTVFFILQRGRDLRLPRYTELEVTLNRLPELPAQ